MSKLVIPLALAAVASVAACTYPATPAPTPVVVPAAPAPIVVVPQPAPAVVTAQPAAAVVVPQTPALRPGVGRVESITTIPAPNTASGSTQRFGIKMGDGTVQYVDSNAPTIAIGDRVELTGNGYLRHPI